MKIWENDYTCRTVRKEFPEWERVVYATAPLEQFSEKIDQYRSTGCRCCCMLGLFEEMLEIDDSALASAGEGKRTFAWSTGIRTLICFLSRDLIRVAVVSGIRAFDVVLVVEVVLAWTAVSGVLANMRTSFDMCIWDWTFGGLLGSCCSFFRCSSGS